MKSRNLKFPPALFCAVLRIEPVILRKWLSGNSLDVQLTLDGGNERAADTAPRFYTFSDLVRVHLLLQLRDELGVSTSNAIKTLNAAFEEIAKGVAHAWKGIDNDGYRWGEKSGVLDGPWLVLNFKGRKITSILAKGKTSLVETAETGGLVCSMICDIRFAVQRVSIMLTNDAVEADCKALLETAKRDA